MDRSEYPGMLPKLQPAQAVEILNDRVRQVGRLNTAIADWLQERRRLEDQYAAGLRRLSRQNVDESDLGIFSVPWGTLLSSMNTLADSHSALATKIGADVERPLREFNTSDRQMTAMTTIQGNLASIAKDVDKAQQKTDKLQGKSGSTNKAADASSDLDNAKAQWDSQAPYVFETLQSLDEHRVNQLRDLLTQFQTLEVDQVEKNRVAAEQCLNILLNVETQDEIKTFALKAVASKPRARPTSTLPPTLTPSRTANTSSSNLTPIRSLGEDGNSASGAVQEKEKKGRLGGLKRLSTVMGRRKDKQAIQLPAMEEAEESPERSRTSRFNSLGRLGRSKDSYTSDAPQDEGSSLQRPRSPLRLGSEVMEPVDSRGQESSAAASSPSKMNIPNGSHQGDLADLDPPKPSQPEAAPIPAIAEPQRDAEGFSVPPSSLDPISQAQASADSSMISDSTPPQFNLNIRNEPIREEGGDATLAAAKLQAPPVTTRRAGTVRGRRNDRNSFVSPDSYSTEHIPTSAATGERAPSPAQFDAPAAQAPSLVGNASHAQSSSGGFSPAAIAAIGGTGAAAAAAGFTAVGAAAGTQSPIRSPKLAGTAEATADTQSIRSGRSLASTTSLGLKHPDLNEPGLNSSIVETVSARFDHGRLTSSSLIGEIALAYNAPSPSAAVGYETIRLDNFSSLEKVAPNPAFLTQTPDKDGEYSVHLASLARTQLAFKYQLTHDAAGAQAPLLVVPAFKIEPTQSSVIVSYSLHPDFALAASPSVGSSSSITLHNVTLALTLEGAKASSCLSKPVGTFSREKNVIYWQLNDLVLTPGAAPEKLLARFVTDAEASGGAVEAKWELTGDAAARARGSGLAVSLLSSSGNNNNSQAGGGLASADPFADDEGHAGHGAAPAWRPVPEVKRLVSGSYVARS